MTSTLGHCGPAVITSKLAIILGLILGVTLKQTQRSSVAAAAAAGPPAKETWLNERAGRALSQPLGSGDCGGRLGCVRHSVLCTYCALTFS